MGFWLVGCAEAEPVSVVVPGPLPAPAATPAPVEVGRATIAAVGDTMMHGAVLQSAALANVVADGVSTNHGGFEALWAAVTPRLLRADVAFTNLESPVAPSGKPFESMVFNAPPDVLGALVASGFDVVSGANNHAWDQGRAGLLETLAAHDAAGVGRIGIGYTCAEARAHRMIERNGVKMAFVGTSSVFNFVYRYRPELECVDSLDEPGLLAEAAAARAAGADLVVLSAHWGVEYAAAPDPVEQIERAHRLVDGGYDVILGHHPHVLQPLAWRDTPDGRRALIAYSLGNFVSNQSAWYEPGVHPFADGNPRDGLLLELAAVKRRSADGTVRTTVEDVRPIPLWTRDDVSTAIRVVPFADEVAALEEALAAETDPDAIAARTKAVDHARERVAGIARALGPGWMEDR